MNKGIFIFCLAAGVATATVANAAVINLRPVIMNPNDEASLDQVLNKNIHDSGPRIDVSADQNPTAVFTHEANDGAVATMIIELANLAKVNTFGLYSYGDTSNKVEIFAGSAKQGNQVQVSFLANGDVMVNNTVVAHNFSRDFGFYLQNNRNTWYTEDSKNGGEAHSLVYKGNDLTKLKLPGQQPGTFNKDDWIVAWEDLPHSWSDKDYNDMVVMIQSIVPAGPVCPVNPVPEPATWIVWLLLGTTAGLGIVYQRRKRLQG